MIAHFGHPGQVSQRRHVRFLRMTDAIMEMHCSRTLSPLSVVKLSLFRGFVPDLRTFSTVSLLMFHSAETVSQQENTCAGKMSFMVSPYFSTLAMMSAYLRPELVPIMTGHLLFDEEV